MLDGEYEVWKTYENHYWPREFLVDGKGVIRYDHIGEGGYAQTENMIQVLLREIHPDVEFPPPMEYLREEDRPGAVCYIKTPETYAGYRRGLYATEVIRNEAYNYEDRGVYPDGRIVLQGTWQVQGDRLKHSHGARRGEDYLGLRF